MNAYAATTGAKGPSSRRSRIAATILRGLSDYGYHLAGMVPPSTGVDHRGTSAR